MYFYVRAGVSWLDFRLVGVIGKPSFSLEVKKDGDTVQSLETYRLEFNRDLTQLTLVK